MRKVALSLLVAVAVAAAVAQERMYDADTTFLSYLPTLDVSPIRPVTAGMLPSGVPAPHLFFYYSPYLLPSTKDLSSALRYTPRWEMHGSVLVYGGPYYYHVPRPFGFNPGWALAWANAAISDIYNYYLPMYGSRFASPQQARIWGQMSAWFARLGGIQNYYIYYVYPLSNWEIYNRLNSWCGISGVW